MLHYKTLFFYSILPLFSYSIILCGNIDLAHEMPKMAIKLSSLLIHWVHGWSISPLDPRYFKSIVPQSMRTKINIFEVDNEVCWWNEPLISTSFDSWNNAFFFLLKEILPQILTVVFRYADTASCRYPNP